MTMEWTQESVTQSRQLGYRKGGADTALYLLLDKARGPSVN